MLEIPESELITQLLFLCTKTGVLTKKNVEVKDEFNPDEEICVNTEFKNVKKRISCVPAKTAARKGD